MSMADGSDLPRGRTSECNAGSTIVFVLIRCRSGVMTPTIW